MQEARGTPSPMPTHSFSASPWHRHQLTGSFVCANCAAPMSLCVVYSIHGLVALLLHFSVVIGGAVEPPAAHTFERARLWHPHYVPPTRSSLLDRGAQDVILWANTFEFRCHCRSSPLALATADCRTLKAIRSGVRRGDGLLCAGSTPLQWARNGLTLTTANDLQE